MKQDKFKDLDGLSKEELLELQDKIDAELKKHGYLALWNDEVVVSSIFEQPKEWRGEENCLVSQFFANEKSKPEWMRSNFCHVVCSCSKCNPARL